MGSATPANFGREARSSRKSELSPARRSDARSAGNSRPWPQGRLHDLNEADVAYIFAQRISKACAKGDNSNHYSTTSVVRSRIEGGTARPSALAVLRFRAISNFVGNCTGRSPASRRVE